jgi:hypothetical protein
MEIHMKMKWLALVAAAALVVSAGSALARSKHRTAPPRCDDRPYQNPLNRLFFNPGVEPNGCAPAVYQFGRYVGQDPDPNIRFQLRRDPATGYTSDLQN